MTGSYRDRIEQLDRAIVGIREDIEEWRRPRPGVPNNTLDAAIGHIEWLLDKAAQFRALLDALRARGCSHCCHWRDECEQCCWCFCAFPNDKLDTADQPTDEGCIGKDPTCPCQDGDWCHYVDDPATGTKGWPIPTNEGTVSGDAGCCHTEHTNGPTGHRIGQIPVDRHGYSHWESCPVTETRCHAEHRWEHTTTGQAIRCGRSDVAESWETCPVTPAAETIEPHAFVNNWLNCCTVCGEGWENIYGDGIHGPLIETTTADRGDTMSTDDVRVRHGLEPNTNFCWRCLEEMPCDAIALADRLDNAERAIEAVRALALQWDAYTSSYGGDYGRGLEMARYSDSDELLAALDAALSPRTDTEFIAAEFDVPGYGITRVVPIGPPAGGEDE